VSSVARLFTIAVARRWARTLGVQMKYAGAEREAIGLCITLEAINDIANHELLKLTDIVSLPGQAEVHFPSRTHQHLFLTRLLDFAKENGDASLTGTRGSCLDVLEASCDSKAFNVNCSVLPLQQFTAALTQWLQENTPLKLWLPTVNINADLNVPRIEFLYISGNQVKHNLSRLTGLSRRIQAILHEHGYNVDLDQIPLALDDFQEHLQDGYFVYYGTWLTELLNNVRWGLQDYLLPTFNASIRFKPENPPMYFYEYPDSISAEIPRAWFWRLMNHVRSGPYLKRFVCAEHMKRNSLG